VTDLITPGLAHLHIQHTLSMFNLDRIFDQYGSKSHERYRLAATLEGHSGPINSFAFNPSGTMLASGDEDILVLLFS
jgi:WD40 repeat protein